jgi:hypothetical protein
MENAVPMDEDEGGFWATPLWYAVSRGENLPLVEFLLQREANAIYSLWAAVWRDDDVLCRVLLKSKPELDLRAHGETPIFYADCCAQPRGLGATVYRLAGRSG